MECSCEVVLVTGRAVYRALLLGNHSHPLEILLTESQRRQSVVGVRDTARIIELASASERLLERATCWAIFSLVCEQAPHPDEACDKTVVPARSQSQDGLLQELNCPRQ